MVAGDELIISMVFTEPVNVIGLPYLNITTIPARTAVYRDGTGTNTIRFSYIVQAGDTSSQIGYSSTSSLVIPALASIADVATNAMTNILPVVGSPTSLQGSSSVTVDTNAPYIVRLAILNPQPTYTLGQTVTIRAYMSEPVSVTVGITPATLPLETGTTDNIATLQTPTLLPTSYLDFNYVVTATDSVNKLDTKTSQPLTINNSIIKDLGLNSLVTTLPTPGGIYSMGYNTPVLIDGITPYIVNIASLPSTGRLYTASPLTLVVTFSEPMNVTGNPQIQLSTSPVVYAQYVSGSGTNTLIFTTTMPSGITASSLDLVALTPFVSSVVSYVKDFAGNAVTAAAPTGSTTGSLATNSSGLTVDSVIPNYLIFNQGTITTNGVETTLFRFVFSKSIDVGTFINSAISLADSSTTTKLVSSISLIGGTSDKEFSVIVTSTGNGTVIAKLNQNIVKDISGNYVYAPTTGGHGISVTVVSGSNNSSTIVIGGGGGGGSGGGSVIKTVTASDSSVKKTDSAIKMALCNNLPNNTYKRGASFESVRDIEATINYLRTAQDVLIKVDTEFTKETEKAIMSLQTRLNIKKTGQWNTATYKAVFDKLGCVQTNVKTKPITLVKKIIPSKQNLINTQKDYDLLVSMGNSGYDMVCGMIPMIDILKDSRSEEIRDLGIVASYVLGEKQVLLTQQFNTELSKKLREIQTKNNLLVTGEYTSIIRNMLIKRFECNASNQTKVSKNKKLLTVYLKNDLSDFVDFKNSNNIFSVIVPRNTIVERNLLKKIQIPSRSAVDERIDLLNSKQIDMLCKNLPLETIDRDTNRLLPLDSIWWIQLSLNIALGMDNDVDGVYGRYTKKIISEFQTQGGNKKTTGAWDIETQKQMKIWMSCI